MQLDSLHNIDWLTESHHLRVLQGEWQHKENEATPSLIHLECAVVYFTILYSHTHKRIQCCAFFFAWELRRSLINHAYRIKIYFHRAVRHSTVQNNSGLYSTVYIITDYVLHWFLFNSIQDHLYSAFYDIIVAKQLCRKWSFYNRFIYCRNLIYLIYGKIWFILYAVWGLASSEVLWGVGIISSHVFSHLRSFYLSFYLIKIIENGLYRLRMFNLSPF